MHRSKNWKGWTRKINLPTILDTRTKHVVSTDVSMKRSLFEAVRHGAWALCKFGFQIYSICMVWEISHPRSKNENWFLVLKSLGQTEINEKLLHKASEDYYRKKNGFVKANYNPLWVRSMYKMRNTRGQEFEITD